MNARKRRVALIGTGHRGLGTWGKELIQTCGDTVEIVALCDQNALRLERAGEVLPGAPRLYAELDDLLSAERPDTLIVCTRDADHDDACREGARSGLPRRHREADGDDRREGAPHPRGRAPHRRPRRRHLQLPLRADRRAHQGAAARQVPSARFSPSISTGISTSSTAPTISAAGTPTSAIPAASSCTRRRTISTCSTGISPPSPRRFSPAATCASTAATARSAARAAATCAACAANAAFTSTSAATRGSTCSTRTPPASTATCATPASSARTSTSPTR